MIAVIRPLVEDVLPGFDAASFDSTAPYPLGTIKKATNTPRCRSAARFNDVVESYQKRCGEA
jgi:hypothetical protein